MCKHPRIWVVRTFDLERERATCHYCKDEVPDWRSISHVGREFWYRYLTNLEFDREVLPDVKLTAAT